MNKEEIRKFRGKVMSLEEDIKFIDTLSSIKRKLDTPRYTDEFQKNFIGVTMRIEASTEPSDNLCINIKKDFLTEESVSKIREFFETLCDDTMNSIENDMRNILDTIEVSDSIPNAKKGLYDEDDDIPSI